MKIKKTNPPNFDQIHEFLPRSHGTIYCYGDTIYNPDCVHIGDHLVAHEYVHSKRQGDNPEGWWGVYLKSSVFRLEEELWACAGEYVARAPKLNRKFRRMHIAEMVNRMTSPMYGCGHYSKTAVKAALMERIKDALKGD